MIKELIRLNRSYRRFLENESIGTGILMELVDLARLSPSAANMQPFKYIISNTPQRNSLIFPHLAWAAYLTDWSGPHVGERPSAYIIILGDTKISTSFSCDYGIAAHSILLGATEKGLGGCIIGSIKKEELMKVLSIPDFYKILLVIALGKPAEKIVLEEVDSDGAIQYWRDSNGVHHVPKRSLDDIIIQL